MSDTSAVISLRGMAPSRSNCALEPVKSITVLGEPCGRSPAVNTAATSTSEKSYFSQSVYGADPAAAALAIANGPVFFKISSTNAVDGTRTLI